MDRKMASVQKVVEIEPIEGADFIEKIRVQGWDTISQKGQYKVGDLAVFFEIDSVLPSVEWSDFLEGHMRIRSKKLRGVLSQGLLLPLSILPEWIEPEQAVAEDDRYRLKVTHRKEHGNNVQAKYREGDDVTEILGVTKWEPEVRDEGVGIRFPSDIPKTNETRVQSAIKILDEMAGLPYYATVKLDGRSMTAWFNPEDGLHMASHNLEKKQGTGIEWDYAGKHKLEETLKNWPNMVFQGELCGPGIQKNRLNIPEYRWYVFNIFDRTEHKYLSYYDMVAILAEAKLLSAPIEEIGDNFNYDLDELLAKADGVYADSGGNVREGLVFRTIEETHSRVMQGRTSFKVISNKYLLKAEKEIDKAEKAAEVAEALPI